MFGLCLHRPILILLAAILAAVVCLVIGRQWIRSARQRSTDEPDFFDQGMWWMFVLLGLGSLSMLLFLSFTFLQFGSC